MQPELLNTVLITLSITAVSAVVLASFFVVLRDRSKSEYRQYEHRAVLSEMRESFEARIRELQMQLMSTQERWKDVNHLLISAQNNAPAENTSGRTRIPEFFRSMGVTDDDAEVDPKLILVLTPFHPTYREAYETISMVCQKAGFRCLRGDEEQAKGDILAHVIKLMVKARLIIVNIGGRNPNVLYELGLAHALDKRTILISQNLNSVPFDIRSKRILIYHNVEELRHDLTQALLRAVTD